MSTGGVPSFPHPHRPVRAGRVKPRRWLRSLADSGPRRPGNGWPGDVSRVFPTTYASPEFFRVCAAVGSFGNIVFLATCFRRPVVHARVHNCRRTASPSRTEGPTVLITPGVHAMRSVERRALGRSERKEWQRWVAHVLSGHGGADDIRLGPCPRIFADMTNRAILTSRRFPADGG